MKKFASIRGHSWFQTICQSLAIFSIASLTFCQPLAKAENITIASGRTLENIEVLQVYPNGLELRHAGGIGRFHFRELPPEIRERYNADPEKARAYEQQLAAHAQTQAAQNRARRAEQEQQALQSMEKNRGIQQQQTAAKQATAGARQFSNLYVWQNTKDGILCVPGKSEKYEDKGRAAWRPVYTTRDLSKAVHIQGVRAPDATLWSGKAVESGLKTVDGITVKNYRAVQ